jgi:hypothetical protein
MNSNVHYCIQEAWEWTLSSSKRFQSRPLGRSPTEATRLWFDQGKSQLHFYSWQVVIASWSRWWEKRHYDQLATFFSLIESLSRRLSGRTASHSVPLRSTLFIHFHLLLDFSSSFFPSGKVFHIFWQSRYRINWNVYSEILWPSVEQTF